MKALCFNKPAVSTDLLPDREEDITELNIYNRIEGKQLKTITGALTGDNGGIYLSGRYTDNTNFLLRGVNEFVPCPEAAVASVRGKPLSASSPLTAAPTRASEQLKEKLKSTVLKDGTRFLIGNEFPTLERPYFIVKVRATGTSSFDEKIYKIMLSDLSIEKFFGLSDTTPERFEALQAIVATFRPRANSSETAASGTSTNSRSTMRVPLASEMSELDRKRKRKSRRTNGKNRSRKRRRH